MLGVTPLAGRTICVALSVHTALLILRDEGTWRGVRVGSFGDRPRVASLPPKQRSLAPIEFDSYHVCGKRAEVFKSL